MILSFNILRGSVSSEKQKHLSCSSSSRSLWWRPVNNSPPEVVDLSVVTCLLSSEFLLWTPPKLHQRIRNTASVLKYVWRFSNSHILLTMRFHSQIKAVRSRVMTQWPTNVFLSHYSILTSQEQRTHWFWNAPMVLNVSCYYRPPSLSPHTTSFWDIEFTLDRFHEAHAIVELRLLFRETFQFVQATNQKNQNT